MSNSDPILAQIEAQARALRIKNGATPLILACLDYDEAEFNRLLPESDVNAADKALRTALHEVVRYAHRNEAVALRMAERLIEAGANVNAQDKADKYAPLMEAAIYGSLPLVELLLALGADPNLRAKGRQTAIALIEAAPSLKRTRKTVIKALEAAGAKR